MATPQSFPAAAQPFARRTRPPSVTPTAVSPNEEKFHREANTDVSIPAGQAFRDFVSDYNSVVGPAQEFDFKESSTRSPTQPHTRIRTLEIIGPILDGKQENFKVDCYSHYKQDATTNGTVMITTHIEHLSWEGGKLAGVAIREEPVLRGKGPGIGVYVDKKNEVRTPIPGQSADEITEAIFASVRDWADHHNRTAMIVLRQRAARSASPTDPN